MKKFITCFFLFVFAAAAVHAQDMQRMPSRQDAKLTISSFYTGSLRLMVDGNSYNINRDNDFELSDLTQGSHSIKVWQMPQRNHGAIGSMAIRVIYQGTVYLRGGYHTDIFINRFNHAMEDEQLIDVNNDPNHPTTNQPPYTGYNPAMTAENFNAFKATLRNESFDNSRLNIARQVAASNYFSAAQVKEIMAFFSYDESRLDIAKTFYPRVTDKQNYFRVNDAFTFSSSKDALADFLSKQQP